MVTVGPSCPHACSSPLPPLGVTAARLPGGSGSSLPEVFSFTVSPPKRNCLQAERDSAGGLQEELRRAKEQIQLLTQELREREAERQVSGEALEGHAEARPTRTPPAAGQRAQSDRQPLTRTFALRELQMRQLHDAQAAQIRALEASLVEQQGRLRQLELGLAGDASPQCSQCGREPAAGPAPADRDQELAAARLREDCALQLQLAQNRWVTFSPLSGAHRLSGSPTRPDPGRPAETSGGALQRPCPHPKTGTGHAAL